MPRLSTTVINLSNPKAGRRKNKKASQASRQVWQRSRKHSVRIFRCGAITIFSGSPKINVLENQYPEISHKSDAQKLCRNATRQRIVRSVPGTAAANVLYGSFGTDPWDAMTVYFEPSEEFEQRNW